MDIQTDIATPWAPDGPKKHKKYLDVSGVVFAEKMYQEQSSLQSLMDTLRPEPLKNQNELEFNNKQTFSFIQWK